MGAKLLNGTINDVLRAHMSCEFCATSLPFFPALSMLEIERTVDPYELTYFRKHLHRCFAAFGKQSP